MKELNARNHDVVRSIDCLGQGATDPMVFAHAINDDRILLTGNCDDFIELAKATDDHPGVLLIYPDENGNAMSTSDIAKAIINVWQSFGGDSKTLRGQRIPLPQYLW